MLTSAQLAYLRELLTLPPESRGLLWHGAPGRGKSELLRFVYQQYQQDQGDRYCLQPVQRLVRNQRTGVVFQTLIPVIRFRIPDLVQTWRAYGGVGDIEGKERIRGQLQTASVVILEELGRELVTEHAGSVSKEILDQLLEETDARILMTSNLSSEDIARVYDQSMLWRLQKLKWSLWPESLPDLSRGHDFSKVPDPDELLRGLLRFSNSDKIFDS